MIILIVVLIMSYVYCFFIATDKKLHPVLKTINQACLIGCKKCAYRGDSYILENEEKSNAMKNCLLTSWNVYHILMYLLLGYLYPNLYYKLIAMGVGFEIYEYITYDCADLMDIPSNIIGVSMGARLSKLI